MSKQILLMRPNSTNDKKDNFVTFPMGLGYIAAVLKKKGHNVDVLDLTLEDVNYDSLMEFIDTIHPDVIGISAMSYEYSQVRKLSNLIKKNSSSCLIVLGGHLASHNYRMVLEKTGVDVCVIGEGELTIIDLLNNLHDLRNVDGISYKACDKIVLAKPRELINDLDTIPFPAYELFDVDRYSRMLMDDIYMPKKLLPQRKEYKKMSVESGRGCPFSCNFCSKMFKRIRRRSTQSVFEEMKYLNEKYDINVFGFQDELMFIDNKYIADFCKKIKPLDISWYGNARIDTVNEEMIRLLVKNNCISMGFGVESGSEKILKNMNKKTMPLKIKNTLKMVKRVGLPFDMGLILGYIGEDKGTVNETINLLKDVGYPGLRFRYITPYPGSQLYNHCIENKIIKNEEVYLESIGDGTGPYRPRINFTKFTDGELSNLVPETVKKTFRNYLFYLLKHPKYLFECLKYKDFMNPIYYLYNRWMHPTNYDKGAKKRK